MSLPLSCIYENIPTSHWITRHHHLKVSDFYIIDINSHLLRLQQPTDRPKHRTFLHKLTIDLLIRKLFKYKDSLLFWFQEVIIPDPTEEGISVLDLIPQSEEYLGYKAKTYRLNLNPVAHRSSRSQYYLVQLVNSIPLLPQSKTLWYRCLMKKLPTQLYLSSIDRSPDDKCKICSTQSIDSLLHFLVECPHKWEVWRTVLGCYYPNLSFSQYMILQAILLESVPHCIKDIRQFLTIIGSTTWNIWKEYWLNHFEGVPFNPANTLKHCLSEISLVKSILDNTYLD
ncbi:hypothetical protein BDB01DRAFT_719477 [Pilobolus umbonatus]|nr:hypothetical protein BDB01DRAFT_719477 [Pilobolus umbonatus]